MNIRIAALAVLLLAGCAPDPPPRPWHWVKDGMQPGEADRANAQCELRALERGANMNYVPACMKAQGWVQKFD